MSVRSQALVPLSTEQQAAWRAVATKTPPSVTRWRNIRMRGRFSAV